VHQSGSRHFLPEEVVFKRHISELCQFQRSASGLVLVLTMMSNSDDLHQSTIRASGVAQPLKRWDLLQVPGFHQVGVLLLRLGRSPHYGGIMKFRALWEMTLHLAVY
jgi:hypothetical protein